MRIFADRLSEQLKRGLHHSYLLFGNEALLLQESRDEILATAKQAGFDERYHFSVDAQLDWNQVFDCCNALSLFASKQVIELALPEGAINTATSNALIELAGLLHPDILLIVIGGKLTKAQENAKWFKALSQQGVWVNCLTPDLQRLPQFVQIRCRRLNLSPDPQALQMIAQWHEGNLLALAQSLQKLALLYPDGQLTLVRVEEALSRNNHFTPFHWIDALLAQKPNRAQRILRQLELEGTEPIILLRTLQRELTLLGKLKADMATMAAGAAFDKHRIWQNKRPLYNATLQRLNDAHIRKLLQGLALAELQSKTQYEHPCWPLITQLTLAFCATDSIMGQMLPFQH